MSVVLAYSDELAAYDMGPAHPLKPERFTLAVDLMRAYGLLAEEPDAPAAGRRARRVEPETVTRADLELVHDPAYIDAVIEASRDPQAFHAQRGIGLGDTPAFHRMHEASSALCGATWAGLRSVFEGEVRRSFSVAGGLHHAHRDRAAGFCVYNDPAVAIAMLRREHPGVRVGYVDIDAHHGDGVQEAFYDERDVLTISVHESGRYLFPGTGRMIEHGEGMGVGSAIKVPLPPLADDVCYHMVLHDVIAPALRAFSPDVIVAQCGADAHHADPLTHLGLTLTGHRWLVAQLARIADDVCDGRICCTGGGGYGTYSVVPRAWTSVLAVLLDVEPAEELPQPWRERVEALSGRPAPHRLSEDRYEPLPGISERVRTETAALVDRVRAGAMLLEDA